MRTLFVSVPLAYPMLREAAFLPPFHRLECLLVSDQRRLPATVTVLWAMVYLRVSQLTKGSLTHNIAAVRTKQSSKWI